MSEITFVNRFSKIIFVLAFIAAAFAVRSNAQPAATAAASAQAEAAEPLVSQIAPTLFHIGPLPVTNSMVCTWIVAALIILIVRVTTWKMKEVPGTGQNVMEALIEGWEGLMGNVLEPKVVKWVFPFAMSFFIFIVISNLTDLLKGGQGQLAVQTRLDSGQPAILRA